MVALSSAVASPAPLLPWLLSRGEEGRLIASLLVREVDAALERGGGAVHFHDGGSGSGGGGGGKLRPFGVDDLRALAVPFWVRDGAILAVR